MPAAQSVQDDAPLSGLNVPAGQSLHSVAAPLLNSPGAQSTQAAAVVAPARVP